MEELFIPDVEKSPSLIKTRNIFETNLVLCFMTKYPMLEFFINVNS